MLRCWQPSAWAVAPDWKGVLEPFWRSAVGQTLGTHITQRLSAGAAIYPSQPLHALELTPLAQVKVVILGQDPYHAAGQAHGLAFSVLPGVKVPPSLRNIYKELARDLGRDPMHCSLQAWACQGVLLLNTCLTVEEGQPGSHARRGWEVLTDSIMAAVSARQTPTVFMLWGGHAQAKQTLIDAKRHLVLCANHPSPLSALRPPQPFIGCGHFSLANAWLQQRKIEPIDW